MNTNNFVFFYLTLAIIGLALAIIIYVDYKSRNKSPKKNLKRKS